MSEPMLTAEKRIEIIEDKVKVLETVDPKWESLSYETKRKIRKLYGDSIREAEVVRINLPDKLFTQKLADLQTKARTLMDEDQANNSPPSKKRKLEVTTHSIMIIFAADDTDKGVKAIKKTEEDVTILRIFNEMKSLDVNDRDAVFAKLSNFLPSLNPDWIVEKNGAFDLNFRFFCDSNENPFPCLNWLLPMVKCASGCTKRSLYIIEHEGYSSRLVGRWIC